MKPVHDANAVIALAASIREQANALVLSLLAERGVMDILPAHGVVLNALFRHGPMHMSALAERIGKKKNTVTGLVNTLEERGYCRREPDPEDGRAQIIVLTRQGEAMRAVQEEVSSELLRRAWRNVNEREQHACIRIMEKILHNLQQDEREV